MPNRKVSYWKIAKHIFLVARIGIKIIIPFVLFFKKLGRYYILISNIAQW